MNSIIDRLSDIETTAEAIVANAEAQKPAIEREIQDKRDKFDEDLERETQEKIQAIRSRLKEEMDRVLDEQRIRNRATIDNLLKDFETNHTAYAKKILSHITEV